MILADTSVWIDHLNRGDGAVEQLLAAGEVIMHPFVLGEIAMGRFPRRSFVLHQLALLPRAIQAADREVRFFIEEHVLFGKGMGYIDAHLLAATRLTPGASLLTRDKHLLSVAERLGLAASL